VRPRRRLRPREEAPLPAERVAEQPSVVADGKIIAPWMSHGAMTPEDQRRLLAVLDFVNAAQPNLRVLDLAGAARASADRGAGHPALAGALERRSSELRHTGDER